jgi:hypothetical protein
LYQKKEDEAEKNSGGMRAAVFAKFPLPRREIGIE